MMNTLRALALMMMGAGSVATIPVVAAFPVAAIIVMANVESAQACDSACQTATWQASRKPFTGGTAPVFVDTCVRLLSTTRYAYMTEVVLVEGDDPQNGRIITSLGLGAGYSFKLANQPAGTEDVYVREFCFSGSLIANETTITFCNGINPGDGNHHTLSLYDNSAVYLRNLKRTGHAGDFLTLLGTKRSYNAPVATFFTATHYQQMFR